MKRLLLSIAGGVLIPILAFGGAVLIGESPNLRWLSRAFVWAFGWPLALLKPLMPNSENASHIAALTRLALYLATPVLDVPVYSLLTYILLSWRAKQRRFS
jgi:formate/nitrite transporter FocA (FNT family)